MIYATGDTHTDWIRRLSKRSFPEQEEMTKEDYVIVLGDFGIWEGSDAEQKRLDWLEERPFTTLFVDGNHENYDVLDAYPVSLWHGGKVHEIRPSVIHLMRGQVFDIDGLSFFSFGGARSHDIQDGVLEKGDPRIKEYRREYRMFRINHVSWWEREMPNEEEIEEGRQNLAAVGNKVDFILTHCAPASIAVQLSVDFKPDPITTYFEEIHQSVEYKRWLFGHYHDNIAVSYKDILLYEQITQIA